MEEWGEVQENWIGESGSGTRCGEKGGEKAWKGGEGDGEEKVIE